MSIRTNSLFAVLLLLLGAQFLTACNRRTREAVTPTPAPVSGTSGVGASDTEVKLGFHTTEAVGQREYVVILADFPGIERQYDLETISERMVWFLGEYFNQASYEKIEFDGSLVGPYQLPKPVEDYKISPINYEVDRGRVLALVNDVINLADEQVEFSEDLYVMISLGAPSAEYGMVGYSAVPGMLGFASDQPITTKNGEVVARAVVFCENAHLGTYIHDTLHMLGGVIDGQRVTPCLYDHELQAKYIGGQDQAKVAVNVGFWDPLSSHWPYQRELPPTGLTSWTKMRLGWIDPDQIALVYPGETATLRLDPLVGGDAETLVIKVPLSENTYYLIENRQSVDSDSYLPADGVLILYGDERVHECQDGQAPVRIVDANPSVEFFNDAAFDVDGNDRFIDLENNLAIVLLAKEDLVYDILITTPDQVSGTYEDSVGATKQHHTDTLP
jgi:M6 family metalloprotease-like protein